MGKRPVGRGASGGVGPTKPKGSSRAAASSTTFSAAPPLCAHGTRMPGPHAVKAINAADRATLLFRVRVRVRVGVGVGVRVRVRVRARWTAALA